MKNQVIREFARNRKVKLWQIAEKLNLSDGNFSRMLRHELTPDKTKEILNIIESLSSLERCTG